MYGITGLLQSVDQPVPVERRFNRNRPKIILEGRKGREDGGEIIPVPVLEDHLILLVHNTDVTVV